MRLPGVKVFHAGTRVDDKGRVVTDGGRVLGVTALGDDLAAAKARAYEAVKLISFAGMHYRTDIADKALKAKPPRCPLSRPSFRPGSAGRERAARSRRVAEPLPCGRGANTSRAATTRERGLSREGGR